MPAAPETIDPLMLWYVDVFFVQRKTHLVLTNPLTKYTFFIFPYSQKSYPRFMDAFQYGLQQAMTFGELEPSGYLSLCDDIIPHLQTNRSASAHLSRIKEDYGSLVKYPAFSNDSPIDQKELNRRMNEYITTYHQKDYDFPKRRFQNELLLRRLV